MPPPQVHGSRPETSLSSGFSEREDSGEENYSLCTELPKMHTLEYLIPLAMDRAGDAHLTGELWGLAGQCDQDSEGEQMKTRHCMGRK